MTECGTAKTPGLLVVYAVRFDGVAGEAALAELDLQVAAGCRAIDPEVTITRGDLVPRHYNPCRSAGLLHDGEPRITEVESMPEMSPEDLSVRTQAETLAAHLGGTATMVFLRGQWLGSVHYVSEGQHFYLRLMAG